MPINSSNPQSMKKSILLLFVLLSGSLIAENVKTIGTSEINGVKIFLSGAQVVRTAKVLLDKGENEISIEGLSSQIDPQSILVSGNGDAMIKGVNFSIDYLKDKKKSPELIRLQDSLKVLQLQLDNIVMNETVYTEEIALLNANKNTGGANTGVNAENLKKVADFFRQRSIEIRLRLIDFKNDKVKLTEKIAKVNDQLNEWNGKLNQPSGTITITMYADLKSSAQLNFSYFVSSASWTPFYELHGKNVKSNIELIYKAAVRQQSGENWDDVHLTLSSGNPQMNNTKPILIPWFLDFYQRRMMRSQAMEKSSAAPMMMDAYSVEGAVSKDDLKSVEVIQSENAVTNEFEIQQNYTVKSGSKDVTVSIDKHTLPAQFNYYVAPRLDKTAYLIASINGWEQLSLLPGEANIYFENTFVGKSFIDPSSTDDTLKLSMGRDQRIVVKREKIQDLSSVKFLGSNVSKKFTYDITIKNSRSELVSILIEDQIPITKNESIKISTDEISKGEMNTETGLIKWNVDLKPGESKTIRLSYTVKYPKGQLINGL